MLDAYKPDIFNNILIDIVMFNETCTTRWSKKYNDVQLKIFFELCLKLQQKFKENSK
jgi:hypothetical protein